MTLTGVLLRSIALAALGAGVLALIALLNPPGMGAAVPPTEEQALAVERQLLCPICTNERLDVCNLAICRDMKRIIRERLTAGTSPDDIILFFETRYGPKVRADLEASGFNLWLYGWIAASILAVGATGGWFLLGLRRRAPRPAPTAPSAPAPGPERSGADDEWLDAQIADDDDRRY